MSSPSPSTEARPGRRLYLRVWLAVAIAATLGALGGLSVALLIVDPPGEIAARMTAAAVSLLEQDRVTPARAQRLADSWGTFVRVLNERGEVVVAVQPQGRSVSSTAPVRHRVQLEKGWRLEAGEFGVQRPPWSAFTLPFIGLALAVGLATFPLVSRMTRRLEAFRQSVTRLGDGEWSARVRVEGNDEVTDLARSFNRSAERIEELVRANRSLLANASHELRSPLARIRMAEELLSDVHGVPAGLAPMQEMRTSIRELDELIDEILLASRLEARGATEPAQVVDLAQICMQEAERVGLQIRLAPLTLLGVPQLLRRLVRNLLENARKYGQGQPIDLTLRHSGAVIELTVSDQGGGVPEADRERIFEAFYRRKGGSESQGGVGLGLSLVRQIALQHGGTAHCESNAPQGARFVCRFPASNASSN
ncbi:ATP-binding protein [Piscinibacterium candidicorallinum]|jgi:signal transduction histidine kinase|uniref:histidine kinase n=1 Tax=Piscinibacterium candidicorallinum TaxID=1793872 RepID=A0ABV7H2S4_9BURK